MRQPTYNQDYSFQYRLYRPFTTIRSRLSCIHCYITTRTPCRPGCAVIPRINRSNYICKLSRQVRDFSLNHCYRKPLILSASNVLLVGLDICSFASGFVVPIPTFPLPVILIFSVTSSTFPDVFSLRVLNARKYSPVDSFILSTSFNSRTY